jgi:hypothetical protein
MAGCRVLPKRWQPHFFAALMCLSVFSGARAEDPAPIMLGESIIVPFELDGGHIIIQASVNGHPPRPFVFDTGGRNIVTPKVAKELNLPAGAGDELLGGIGKHMQETMATTVDSLRIGAAELTGERIIVAEMPNALCDRGARPRVAGLIGPELLRHYVVRIDYQKRQLTLILGAFEPPADGFAVPLTLQITKEGLFKADIVAVEDGVPGHFIIDTGLIGATYLYPAFAEANAMLSHVPKTLTFESPGGVGGHQRVVAGIGKSIAIGSVTFTSPFMVTPADIMAQSHYHRITNSNIFEYRRSLTYDASFAGLLGTSVLARFVVTLDYRGQRAYFQAAREGALTRKWMGTGLIADKPVHEAFEIIDLLPGTAAERAGLHVGQRFVEADGHPARDLSLGDFGALAGDPKRNSLAITMADGRHLDLAIAQILP